MTETSILIPSQHGWAPVSMAAEPSKVPIAGQLGIVDPYRLFAGGGPTKYNPSDLVGIKGLGIFDKMRKDEQIKAAVAFKKHAILAAGWDIVSPEDVGDEWEPREFIAWSFDRLDGAMSDRLMMMLTAIEYGFSVNELVWGEPLSGGPYSRKWPLEDIVSIKPHSVEFEQDEQGHVTNVLQRDVGREVRIPAEKFVLMTYQNEWSNPYGRSDLEACYADWWGKDSTRKWLAIFLERFGIPPIFFFYNPDRYDRTTQDALKDIITNLQAGTASIMPRHSKDDLEPWTPTLAAHVQDVFIPALDRYDRGMARGILMPNLMGATPEQQTGSFARAAVVFDVFMFAVDALREHLEQVINDQIIWRMVSVNYPSESDQYPRFKFKPLTQDSRIALLDTWVKLVGGRSVLAREEDEVHIRDIMGFPAADSEPIAPPEPVVPPPGSDEDDEEAGEERFAQREINFKAIEKRLDANEKFFVEEAKDDLEEVLMILQRSIKAGQQPTSVTSIRGMSPFQASLRMMMMSALEDGQRDLASEVGGIKKLQAFPRVKPRDAIAFLKRKAITLTATVEDEILRDVRRILIAGVETGMSTAEVTDALGVVFEKWLGSDVLRDGEVVKPYRLEAIARTETTSAYVNGRVVAARDPELKGLIRGLRYDAILDSRTSDCCLALNSRIFRIDSPDLDALSPPNHVNAISQGEPVLTGRGQVPIESVRIGDVVWTHRSRWRKVYATMQKHWDKPTVNRIDISSGRELLITQEHPLLTPAGWVAVRDLHVGDQVFEDRQQIARGERVAVTHPEDFPSLFDEEAISWDHVLTAFPTTLVAVDFQRDPVFRESKVNGVLSHGMLEDNRNVKFGEYGQHGQLGLVRVSAPGDRPRLRRSLANLNRQCRVILHHAFGNIPEKLARLLTQTMSPVALARSLGYHFRQPACDLHLLVPGSDCNPMPLAPPVEDRRAKLQASFNLADGLAETEVSFLDQSGNGGPVAKVNHGKRPLWVNTGIISIADVPYNGMVYNLGVEEDESYLVRGVITHNCRSILTPITVSRQVDESEFITPSEVGKAKELAGSGFAGGGSF